MCLFCRHKWVEIDSQITNIYEDEDSKRQCDIVKAYVLKCEKCGKIKRKKIKLI